MRDLLLKRQDDAVIQELTTTTVDLGFQAENCTEHRFGLSENRWSCLAGKTFWITGAGTGYGRCIAIALAAAGATVFLSGRRAEKLQETIDEIKDLHIETSDVNAICVDVTDSNAVAQVLEKITRISGDLYGLIHCAGLPQPPAGSWPLADMTKEQWDAIIATNVSAPWLVTRTALPLMTAGGAARVLFLSSNAGWHFTPGVGAYNVSKAALNSLAGSFAAECAEQFPDCDIQINVLDPGEARTEMNQGSDDSPYQVVPMALLLLSHAPGGPNGYFFNRYGGHLAFCSTTYYNNALT